MSQLWDQSPHPRLEGIKPGSSEAGSRLSLQGLFTLTAVGATRSDETRLAPYGT